MPSRRSLAVPLLWVTLSACPRPDPAQRDAEAPRGEEGSASDNNTPIPLLPDALGADERQPEGYVGVVAAGEQTDVGPAITGGVVSVHVRTGDYIEAGEPIATLDARRAREDLRMTEATLRSEKAALGQAKIDREEAASRLEKANKLVETGAISRGAVEDAQFQYRRAKATEARVDAVVAQWRTKRVQLERQLADTELRAPFSGTVAERYVDPGAMAGPGVPVVRLISSDALWVRFAVPAHELRALAVGTILMTKIEDPPITVEATVRQIAPEKDLASQLAFIEAELDLDEDQRSTIQAGAAAWVRPMAPDPGAASER